MVLDSFVCFPSWCFEKNCQNPQPRDCNPVQLKQTTCVKWFLSNFVEVEQFECQVPKSLESKHHRALWLNAIQRMFCNLGLGEFGASAEVLINHGEENVVFLQCDATKDFMSSFKGLSLYFMAISKWFSKFGAFQFVSFMYNGSHC